MAATVYQLGKGRHSSPGGNCVEMTQLSEYTVAVKWLVRDSVRPDAPTLVFTLAVRQDS